MVDLEDLFWKVEVVSVRLHFIKSRTRTNHDRGFARVWN